MTELVKHHEGQIIAARIHAYAPDRLPPFDKPELRAFWKHAGDLGLAVQLHFEPRYAPGFEPLIKEFPRATVIIDHLGRPFQGSPEENAVVLGWSRLPNAVMKLSSLPDKGQYPHREVGPVIKELTVARFGPDRLIYGGGFGAGGHRGDLPRPTGRRGPLLPDGPFCRRTKRRVLRMRTAARALRVHDGLREGPFALERPGKAITLDEASSEPSVIRAPVGEVATWTSERLLPPSSSGSSPDRPRPRPWT